jgi:hypothetical protein
MRFSPDSRSEICRALRAEGIHSLHVPRQAHQTPFATHGGDTAQQELPKFHHVLDQSEHRLHRAFAQCILLAPASGLQAMAHGRQRRWPTLQWRRLGKAFKQPAMMGFAAERDQRLDLGLGTGVDVVFTGIPGIVPRSLIGLGFPPRIESGIPANPRATPRQTKTACIAASR